MSEFVFSAISQKHCISQLIDKMFANCVLPVKRHVDSYFSNIKNGMLRLWRVLSTFLDGKSTSQRTALTKLKN